MILLILLFFILGSAVGSFLNVVIDRTVRGESILGRSYCDHCKATLVAVDLIPIISFVGFWRPAAAIAKSRFLGSIRWSRLLTGLLFVLAFIVLVQSGQLSLPTLAYYFSGFHINSGSCC